MKPNWIARASTISALLGVLVTLSACRAEKDTGQAADLILTNGNIITVDPNRPKAEAVAIKDDIILAVGSNEDIAEHRGEKTKVIDLRGETAVPGLIDAHMHFPLLGKRLEQLFLDKTTRVEEAVEIIRAEVEKTPPGEWITGQGWHTANWNVTEYPDKSWLDQVSPMNPVFLVGMASHAAWVNDRALELAGITRDTSDPPGGHIVRDPDTGEPTGILLEKAQNLISRLFPPETRATKKRDIELSIQTALSLGLTEVHDAGVGDDVVEIYKELLEEGALAIRLYVMYLVPDGGKVLDEYVKRPPEIGLANHMLTLRTIKAFADGALGARGAALLEPYSDSPEDRGLIRNSEEELYKILHKSSEAGYQVALHAIGDRGNQMVLDAVERLQEVRPDKDSRIRIEHAQILSPEDIPRFARLRVIASMQPIHCTMDMGFVEARVGPRRMKGAYAWKSLLDSGTVVAASSDTPAFPVDYANPLWGIYAAVTRQDNAGRPRKGWYPDEKVSRMDALKMYTIHAAYAGFEEDIKGRLSPGKLADITILSGDILTIPATEIPQTQVLMTIVGGRIAYQKESYRK